MRTLPAPYRFFGLVYKTTFATERHANALFAKDHSHFSEFLILNALRRCSDPSQQNIALFLNLTPAAVSRHIDRLVARGLAKRSAVQNNRRTNRVTLTPKGVSELARMERILTRGFKSHIAVLSDKEMRSTCTVLQKLLDSFTPAE